MKLLFSDRVCTAHVLNRYYLNTDTRRICKRSAWCLAPRKHSVKCHRYSYESPLCGFSCHADSARRIPRRITGTQCRRGGKKVRTHTRMLNVLPFLSNGDVVFGGRFPWKRRRFPLNVHAGACHVPGSAAATKSFMSHSDVGRK